MPDPLIAALEQLWSDLPALAGEAWSALEPRLRDLLARARRAPDAEREAACVTEIEDLLAEHAPRALQRLEPLLVSRPIDTTRQGHSARLVTRHTEITCPRRVWVEAPPLPVFVRLTVAPREGSAGLERLELLAETAVEVRLEAPGFELLGPARQTLTLPADTDSAPLAFDVRPRVAGATRLSFEFSQGSEPLGVATVEVEITRQPVETVNIAAPGPRAQLASGGERIDLTLRVRRPRQDALEIELLRDGELPYSFAPVPLRGDLAAYMAHAYAELTALSAGSDPAAKTLFQRQVMMPDDDVDRRLRKFGQNLWRDLVPPGLKELYAQERALWADGQATLLVLSDEPYIPWELVWPYDPEGAWEDAEPWCLTFRLARWLSLDRQGQGQAAPPRRLDLRRVACLAPPDADLPGAAEEVPRLRAMLAAHGVSDVSPRPTWAAVMDLLEGRDGRSYDWLHASTHGHFRAGPAPDADAPIRLEGGATLTPNDIVGQAEAQIRRQRPAFVFNACSVGRRGWALTRMGGWADRLLAAQAALFLAPLWEVSDDTAGTFSEAFYAQLLRGHGAADAVRAGRRAARQPGDPTWLAYSLYAHPHARLA